MSKFGVHDWATERIQVQNSEITSSLSAKNMINENRKEMREYTTEEGMQKFSARRAALRLLSSPSTSSFVKVRSLATFQASSLQRSRPTLSSSFQKRWATNQSEAEKDEDVPVSHLQPTPQEEVENAISEDNAATSVGETSAESESVAQKVTGAGGADVAEAFDDSTALEEAESVQAADATSVKESQESTVDSTQAAVTNAVAGTGGHDRPRGDNFVQAVRTPKETIYIGNLFFDVTESDVVKELARFGTIKHARLIRDARGLSKGFGYVEFETVDMAQKAVESLHQQLFEGRRLNVQYAAQNFSETGKDRPIRPNQPQNPPTKTLFIGNMSFEMTDRDLNNLFKGIRNVVDVRVAIDRRTGQPRGFAHADFVDVKSAVEAMKVLTDKETYGRKLRIDYSYGPSTAPRNTPRES